MRARAAVLAASIALSGCLAPAPRVDPLAGMEAGPAHPELSAVVAVSENTKKAADYAARAERMSLGHFKADELFADIHELLRRNFKSVVKVDSPASAGEADVLILLDVHVKVGQTLFAESTADYRLIFMKGEQVLGEAKGFGVRKASKDTSFDIFLNGTKRLYHAFAMARRDALAALGRSLREQPALRRLAASKSAAPAAAAPQAAPGFSSDVEAPVYRLPDDPDKFALVIGVERYSGGLPSADHAARDASAMKAHLLALGYPERNIVLLSNEQAGRAALAKYLEAWLPRNTTVRSKVLFYFSGHGAPDPAKGEGYLLPWDGDPKFLEATAYPMKKVYERLGALPAKDVLAVVDACFSGAGGRSVLAKGTRPLVTRVDAGAAAAGRVTALSASAADEITGSDERSGHGLFTYHLLKSLAETEGRATFKELHRALSPKVSDAARRDNRDQTPQLVGSGEAAF